MNDNADPPVAPPAPPPPPPSPPSPPIAPLADDAAFPVAHAKRRRWIGIVWAVPLAALLIVAFLGVRALADRGIDVVVTFDTGAGAEVKDTKVIYQGVEGGHVTKIEINEDGRRVDMTLRIDARAKPALTTDTTFWLIGARPSLSDISSVKAALAGPSIGVAPATTGKPARRFIGLSEPPIVMPGTPGTRYVLSCPDLGTARAGSPLFFRGQEIGKVTGVRFTPTSDFRLDVFVYAPYDKLIRPQAAFWIASPVQVALTDKGASASLVHAGSLFNGAIEMDFPQGVQPTEQSAPGVEFPLYQSRRDAETGPSGPEVPYALRFSGPAGELVPGAQVRMLGFQIGVVKSVRLDIDPATGQASTAVLAVLYPNKLHIKPPTQAGAAPADASAWREPTDAAVNRLLARGHRARLAQTPPLIGGRVVTFDPVPGAATAAATPATLLATAAGQPRLIPSVDAPGGIDDITSQVNQLMVQINRVPFQAIGQQVQKLTERLTSLVSSPQLTDSLQHLNATLAQVDKMMGEVAPQVGPLVAKLNRAADEVSGTATAARNLVAGDAASGPGGGAAADANLPAAIRELTDAAQSIRVLADYLGRHPESLLRGRGAEPLPAAPAATAAPAPRKDSR